MPVEIERKYLIDSQEWAALEKPEGLPCKQCYLSTNADTTVRVRLMGKNGYLTIKGKTNGLSRPEFEYEIPVEEALQMIQLFGENLIEKTRFIIPHNGKTWEVDVFEAANQGLIIAEIELEGENETFPLPPWVKEEVSGDHRYYNSFLSQNPFRDW